MGCEHVTIAGGHGFICCRGGKTTTCKEKGCRRKATILCDFSVGPDKTCDRPVCRRHATCIGTEYSGTPDADTLDYCREHTAMARPHEVAHGYLHGRLVKIRWDQLSENAREHCAKRGYGPETAAKVVMVSSMGDLGLTQRLDAKTGYDLRLDPEEVEMIEHTCHANGCSGIAHDEIPFCQSCFNQLPEAHRKKLWKGRRLDKLCGACNVKDTEARLRRADDWNQLYHLALTILLQLHYGGCGAPPPYQDDTGFCWACGIPNALEHEVTAKKVVAKFKLPTTPRSRP